MAVWRIFNRPYLKYASSRFTRSYSQGCLVSSVNYGAKQSKICSSDNPNSDICRKPYSVFENVRFLASSVQARFKMEDIETDGPRLNEKITAPFVRLVIEEEHCIVPRSEALRRAKQEELDLVEVQRDANPPVCKIMNYNREKYIRAARMKERAKAKRSETTLKAGIKEVQFSPKIELKDLKLKADQAMRMMERGYRVKCMAVPEKNKDFAPEQLAELLSRFAPLIEDSVVESGPSMEKKQAFVIVRHSKFGESKKGGFKKLKDMDIKTAIQAPPPKEDSAKSERSIAEEKEGTESVSDPGAHLDHVFNKSEKPEFNSSGRRDKTKPGFDVNQTQPVESQNRYAKKEPSNHSARPPTDNRGPVGRDANRYGSRSPNQPPNPQASQPRFTDQVPNQHRTGFQPRSPNQPLNPRPSQPQFPNQAPNQQPTTFGRQSPNQPQNPQPSQPRVPNPAPKQQPTAPGRSSGPASGYGIFSNPTTNQNDR